MRQSQEELRQSLFRCLRINVSQWKGGTEHNLFSQLTTKTVQLELVDPCDSLGVLPVVLNEIEVVGGGQ